MNQAVTWVTMVFGEFSLGILPWNCEYFATGISFNVGFVRCMTSKRLVLDEPNSSFAANVIFPPFATLWKLSNACIEMVVDFICAGLAVAGR